MAADLIVYALVAAGLVFWLRSVLGTKHGEERERSNPFLGGESAENNAFENEQLKPLSSEDRIASLVEDDQKNIGIKDKSAEVGLIDIAQADRDFDIDTFLEGAQDAFAYIVEAYADGDRDTLKALVSEEVYAAFDAGIDQREKDKHTQETEIHAIRKAEVLEASLVAKEARVTVRFIADQTSVTRDEKGEIIDGNPDRTTEMHDIWVFARNIRAKDPTWQLIETRGGFEEDNDLIPDTH